MADKYNINQVSSIQGKWFGIEGKLDHPAFGTDGYRLRYKDGSTFPRYVQKTVDTLERKQSLDENGKRIVLEIPGSKTLTVPEFTIKELQKMTFVEAK